MTPPPPEYKKDELPEYSIPAVLVEETMKLGILPHLKTHAGGSVTYQVTTRQLAWIANLPPHKFERVTLARMFYEFISAVGMKAFIPVDNWKLAMQGVR
jgi:hypothetical protein